MITIFTTPKPFEGHIKIIQENAIRSWKMLVPECEVILLGDAPGVAEVAEEQNCRYFSQVRSNEFGTPLISGLFSQAEKMASHKILCYANCDIMFTNTLVQVVKVVQTKKRYLVVGQRYNVSITDPWDFGHAEWERELDNFVQKYGELNPPRGIDYFLFPKGQFADLPDLVVGRAWWDNWMIYNARRKLIPVIDATRLVLAVHQNHDYSHCKGGLREAYLDGAEVIKNMSYVRNGEILMTIADADWVADGEKVVFAWDRLLHHITQLPLLIPLLKRPILFLMWCSREVKRFLGIG